MGYLSNVAMQSSLREWLKMDKWHSPFAVTLTLKQRLWLDGGASVALTPDLASRNLRHFLNLVNKRVYGSSAQRNGNRIRSVVALEGGHFKRLHYHLMLDCPRDELTMEFPAILTKAWVSTDWGYPQIDIQPCDQGWLNYMTKLRDKADFASAFDWELCHNPN